MHAASPALSQAVVTPLSPGAGLGNPAAPLQAWSAAKRFAFRWFCVYLLLFSLPFPIDRVPVIHALGRMYREAWWAIVPWIANNLLGIDGEVATGMIRSADTLADYVTALSLAVLASVIAAVWSIADRRRAHYARLYDWQRIYLRYLLGTTMLSYGLVKVIQSQFIPPSPHRLVETFGESSPMGLLWAFMGYSTAYTMFVGAAEVVCGAMLFFRRTTTLGLILAIVLLSNIVLLNYCYDVPVKLWSSHILFLAFFLLLPDVKRLVSFLVLHRPTEAPDLGIAAPSWSRGRVAVVKCVVIAVLAYSTIDRAVESYYLWGRGEPRHELHGVYDVTEFRRGDTPVTDRRAWRRVAMTRKAWTVLSMGNGRDVFAAHYDDQQHTVQLTSFYAPSDEVENTLSLTRVAPGVLEVEGELDGERITVRLEIVDESSFLLVNRGFHWIIEAPVLR